MGTSTEKFALVDDGASFIERLEALAHQIQRDGERRNSDGSVPADVYDDLIRALWAVLDAAADVFNQRYH